MDSMIENVSKLVDFCAKHKITFDQFMLCYLLFLDKEYNRRENSERLSPAANIYKYVEQVKRWKLDLIDDLVNKNFLTNNNTPGSNNAYPDLLEVTPFFSNQIFATWDDFDVFWDMYPSLVNSFDGGGRKVPLKSVDRDEAEALYRKRVCNKSTHERVLRALRYGIENDLISMNIRNYIAGDVWKQHEELMKTGSITEGRKFGTTLLNQ